MVTDEYQYINLLFFTLNIPLILANNGELVVCGLIWHKQQEIRSLIVWVTNSDLRNFPQGIKQSLLKAAAVIIEERFRITFFRINGHTSNCDIRVLLVWLENSAFENICNKLRDILFCQFKHSYQGTIIELSVKHLL